MTVADAFRYHGPVTIDHTRLSVEMEDGPWRYRFWLSRDLGSHATCWRPKTDRWCVFIMLNPSTADATRDDQTIKRCRNFALREGCTHLGVVNLFAARATNPRHLADCHDMKTAANGASIRMAIELGDVIIAAWGAHQVRRARPCVEQMVDRIGKTLWCLGTTRDGSPRHPSRLADAAPLVAYREPVL